MKTVPVIAGGLIRWTIFSHLQRILRSLLGHFQMFPDLCITFTSKSLPVILVTSPGNLSSLYENKTQSLMFIMILSGITWSGSSTSSSILPSASLKFKSGSASLPSVTFTLKMFSNLKISPLKNAATSSCHEFQTLQCNFMVSVTTKVLSYTGCLGAHFSLCQLIYVIVIPTFQLFASFIIGYCIIWGSCSGADICPNRAFYGAPNSIDCSFPMRGSKEIKCNFERLLKF